jgi:hypothetical protein
MEYSRMSHYVSDLIADNINSINVAERLANASNDYNLEILKVIGDTAKDRLASSSSRKNLWSIAIALRNRSPLTR